MTLTREQIERDQLPDLCIVCGAETQDRLSRDFSYQANWAQTLTVIGMVCGFFPGLIVAALTERRQRIACPVCPAHRNHWSKFTWFASTGWLLCFPFGTLGAWIVWALPANEEPIKLLGGILGMALGLIIYGVMLARMAGRRPSVESMTTREIRLRPVSPAFARAAEGRGREPGSSNSIAEAELRETSVPDDHELIAVKAEVEGPALVMCFTGLLMLLGNTIAIGVILGESDIAKLFWIPFPGFLVGVAMLIGGLCLRNLWSRGWAQLGAVAGLLPVSPGWVLTGPIGAWLLNYVLNKDTIRQAFLKRVRARL